MKKLILIFVLMSGFAFGQNTFNINYQEHWNKFESKMKMEAILSSLVNTNGQNFKVSVIESAEDSYVLQFTGSLKMKLAISFYENRMAFTFYDQYYLKDKKYILLKDAQVKEANEEILNSIKSEFYNNL